MKEGVSITQKAQERIESLGWSVDGELVGKDFMASLIEFYQMGIEDSINIKKKLKSKKKEGNTNNKKSKNDIQDQEQK